MTSLDIQELELLRFKPILSKYPPSHKGTLQLAFDRVIFLIGSYQKTPELYLDFGIHCNLTLLTNSTLVPLYDFPKEGNLLEPEYFMEKFLKMRDFILGMED
jgi:hypothetical protein